MDTKKLRQKILDLAIRGKLVPQDPNDEPASQLLERIHAEKERLTNEGKIKRIKKSDSDTLENEVPFEIPDSWEWTTIGDIFQHNTGKALNKSDLAEGVLRPYLTTSNVYWNTFDFSEVKEMYFKTSELEKCTVTQGDLLVCEGGDIGRAAIWNYDYAICIQNHIHRLRGFGSISHSLYLYFLMLYKWTDRINGQGIGLQGLSSGLLGKLKVPIPPLAEQKRIVTAIEQWFALIDVLENEKNDLQAAIQQAKSKILDLAIHGKLVPQDPNDEPAIELLKRINPKFEPDCKEQEELPEGWGVASFQVVCNTISSKPYQILQSEIKEYGKLPVISQSANYIEGYSDREDCILKVENPILIFGDHTRVLKYVDFDFIVGADGVKLIQTSLFTKYVYYVLLHIIYNMQGKGYARHYSILSKAQIPIPPYQEQLRIVAKIEELFAVLDSIKESLE